MANQLFLFPDKEKIRIYEFLIVINFPKGLNDYVRGLKDEFYQKFGFFPSRNSKPHVTISKFPFIEKYQKKMFSFLQSRYVGVPPVRIDVNGFKSFSKNNRVIYLHVEESDELDRLKGPFNDLREGFKPKKYFFIFKNPHITIARGLRPDVFEEAQKMYLSRAYQNTFVVSKLKMLRREVKEDGTFGRYEDVGNLLLTG